MSLSDIAKNLGNRFDKLANSSTTGPHRKGAVKTARARVWNIEKQTADLQRYAFADVLGSALSGTGEGAYRAYCAFDSGNNTEGAAELLRMVGSASKMLLFFGKFGGPVGVFVGEILGLVAAILSGSVAEQASVAEQLEKELLKFGGNQTIGRLAGVHRSLSAVGVTLQIEPANSITWEQMLTIGRFSGPDEIIWLGDAETWLMSEDNRDLDIWSEVFEAYVLALSQFLQNFIHGFTALDKTEERGNPTTHVGKALSLLEHNLAHYRRLIDDLTPVAINKGSLWYIGTNGSLYTRKKVITRQGRDDARFTKLYGVSREVVVGFKERLWTLNDSNDLFSGIGPANWPTVQSNVRDVSVVQPTADLALKAGDKGTVSYVYTITGKSKEISLRKWDEALGDKSAESAAFKTATSITGVDDEMRKIVATKGGVLYVLTGENEIEFAWPEHQGNIAYHVMKKATERIYTKAYQRDESGTWRKLNTKDAVKGVTVTDERVYFYNRRAIYSATHEGARADAPAWEVLPSPGNDLSLEETWRFDHVSGCEDGSLAVLIDKSICSMFEDNWRKHAQDDTAVRTFKLPVPGWELFGAIETVVGTLEEMADSLAQQPIATLGPAHLAEVKVKDNAFQPGEVTIAVGGKVYWIWEGTKPHTVTSTTEVFGSTAKTGGGVGYEFTFRDPGIYTYYSKETPAMKATIVVR